MGVIERFPSLFTTGSFYPTGRTKNLRLVVFAAVFIIVAVGGLLYVYSRPAEYRAGARLEINPAEKLTGDTRTSKSADAFPTEVELLTARPALEEVVVRLRSAGFADSVSGPDPVLSCKI
jgi:hypothetical protein